MSWFQDPQLYISRETPGLKLYRMKEPIGTPIALSGWVVHQMVSNYNHFTWSREPLDSPFYRLPGINTPETVLLTRKEDLDSENQALKIIISDLKARNSTLEDDKIKLINNLNGAKTMNLVEKRLFDLEATVATLRDEFKRNYDCEKAEKQVLKEQVSELTSKLKECCGSTDEEPWKSGNSPVPKNWVPFEDLDVQNFPRNASLKIIKAPGALKFVEDTTTNVQASRFYGGLYPIVVVNVEELIPDKHDARFDPNIWGSYSNAGTSFAARKLFKSEM
ncbi:hypothetical protein MKX03_002668 [Papaver bracteatum]|nr:hypothetical protein MKX03_002668 [Papaver bracteatum]